MVLFRVMQADPQALKLTYEDYLYLPEDGKRHEIIEGEHYVSPAPGYRHQNAIVALIRILSTFLQGRDLGRVLVAPFDVVLSDFDVVQPDVLFVSRDRLSILNEKNLRGAPDLVVEVLSDSTRRIDEIVKRRLYERQGVREYWVVDPVLETVKVYRRAEGGFERVAELSTETGGTLRTPLLAGLDIPLHDIFSPS